MRLPQPRGPLSHALSAALRDEAAAPRAFVARDEDDLQISLWMLYEQHYRGFEDVDPRMEWDPALLSVRRGLEERFESLVRKRTRDLVVAAGDAAVGVVDQLQWIADAETSALPAYLQRDATRKEYLEFLALRSVYNLKEADPHAWALPRVSGGAKAALAELQYDEFGGGVGSRVHQELFAEAMRDAGLDASYGAYVSEAPAHLLAVNNVMSLFGLHRRLRGAALGHLAAFEMTSSLPSRRYARGAERFGLQGAARYYHEHVEADAVHEHLAARGICGALVEDEPDLAEDVLLGAAACVVLERDSTDHTLRDWAEGRSAVRPHSRAAVA